MKARCVHDAAGFAMSWREAAYCSPCHTRITGCASLPTARHCRASGGLPVWKALPLTAIASGMLIHRAGAYRR